MDIPNEFTILVDEQDFIDGYRAYRNGEHEGQSSAVAQRIVRYFGEQGAVVHPMVGSFRIRLWFKGTINSVHYIGDNLREAVYSSSEWIDKCEMVRIKDRVELFGYYSHEWANLYETYHKYFPIQCDLPLPIHFKKA